MRRNRPFRNLFAFWLAVLFCLQAASLSLAGYDGTFVFTVFTGSKTVVEPMIVPYTDGQTVEQALESAGITLGKESGILEQVNGVYAPYSICMDGGSFDLTQSASGVTAVCIGERTEDMQPLLPLLRVMGIYLAADNHVQRYAPAREAYEAALRGFRGAEAQVQTLLGDLQNALADYDAILSGARYTVAVTAMQGETTLSAPQLLFEDAYGNVTAAAGEAQLVAGTYTFTVSDGGRNSVRGSLQVAKDTALSVHLPAGEWFGDVYLTDGVTAYPCTQSEKTVQIPDTVENVYLRALQGTDIPDAAETKLFAVYTGKDGTDHTNLSRSWESDAVLLSGLLPRGLQDQTLRLEARFTLPDGYTAVQSCTVRIGRVPTLTALTVSADGVLLPLSFCAEQTAYTLVTNSETVEIYAKPSDDAYHIEGDGPVSSACGTHTVTVSAGDKTQAYSLHIEKRAAAVVRLVCPPQTTAVVCNASGAEITGEDGLYRLTDGEKYSYVSTMDDVFHSRADFTAADGQTVTVTQPDTSVVLCALALYTASSPRTRTTYAFTPAFSADARALSVTAEDAAAVLYAQASAADGCAVEAMYARQTASADTNGTPLVKAVDTPVSATGNATFLNACLARSGFSQTVSFRASRTADGVTMYRDYSVLIRRSLHLSALSIVQATLRNSAGEPAVFARGTTDYQVEIPQDTEALTLRAAYTDGVGGGYSARVNGVPETDIAEYTVYLTGETEQTITVTVFHTDAQSVPVTYSLLVRRKAPVFVRMDIEPAQATVFLARCDTGERVFPKADGYALMPGAAYDCTVTADGCIARQFRLTAPDADETLRIVLQPAPPSDLPQTDGGFAAGRDACNNAVTAAKIPIKAEDAVLYWAAKLGEGTGADACGCPILANGFLYTYAGLHVYKIDPASGRIVAQGEMDRRSGFAIQTPTYAAGMLFVGLNDGAVQAFRADTLESLWIYRNARGGQPNCPIAYRNGCIYTGFWIDEQTEADFVCLRITDEDPQNPLEEKAACWTYTHKGGFYWAGAYADERYVLVGTEDGAFGCLNGYAQVLSFSPETGELLDAVRLPHTGDVRSSITFSEGTAYFTTRSGWFDALDVAADGTFGALRTLRLQNGHPDSVPMTTSTPTLYGGRAYIGVSGASQFTAYSGHNLTVVDIGTFSVCYTVPTQGFAQTSGLLTTAYASDEGDVYIYFFDNYTPGKLRVLRDRPGQTAPSFCTTEQGMDTAYVLFTPQGAHAQYALCSPVADADGTLYFKNDSGYLFALGHAVRSLEITALPNKRSYTAGETFDPEGMRVQATFADGTVRDVTDRVRWSAAPLSETDTDFWIELPVLYHDADGAGGAQDADPFVVLQLEILSADYLSGDADGDGVRTAADAQRIYAHLSGALAMDAAAKKRADFNEDGAVTAEDAVQLIDWLTGLTLQQ